MSERGTVTRIDGQEVTVRIDLEANCAGCMSHEACNIAGKVVVALDPQGLVRSPGEQVEILVSSWAQAAGALLVLGLPLVLFGGGYAAGSRFFPGSGEGPAALLGIGAFALGLTAAWLILRRKRGDSLARVVRLLENALPAKDLCAGCCSKGTEFSEPF